ncbi:hypothetical protein FBU59_004602, partial [Linderina macrospora]
MDSMLAQLRASHPGAAPNYGIILDDHALHPRERITVCGEPVDSVLFNNTVKEVLEEIQSRQPQRARAATQKSATEKLDDLLVDIALRVFEKQHVTLVAIAVSEPAPTPVDAMGLLPSAYKPKDRKQHDDTNFLEHKVMAKFKPETILCGFESLPGYAEQLPSNWRARLMYMLRHPIQIVSSSQPRIVRMQLNSVAQIFSIPVVFAPSLSTMAACKGIQLGVFGPGQNRSAKLALALCQAWTEECGLAKHHPITQGIERAEKKIPSTITLRAPLRRPSVTAAGPISLTVHTAPWMIRGLVSAQCPGRFYSVVGKTRIAASWHFNAAETPADYSHTGEWFASLKASSPRVLLIHLPDSFISSVRYRSESTGNWLTADYRDLLRNLHRPLRKQAWSHCIFATNALYESNVIDSNVPPELSQHVLRDYWTELTGMAQEQIYIAPSLASALKFIAARFSPQMPSPITPSTPNMSFPNLVSVPQAQAQGRALVSNVSMPTLAPRSLSKSATISIDNLRSRRRKFSIANMG